MQYDVAFGIFIGFIFVSLVVLFCILFGKLYIRKIKTYTKLIYEKDLAFQKALTTTIIETQEQVLNSISQDLHDDAGQQLTFINFQIENLKLDSRELETALAPVSDSLQGLSKSIRSISHSLNNQLLLQQDLLKAIEAEVKRLNAGGLTVQYAVNGKARIFNANEKIIIYRIFQEIVANALKHGKATSVWVGVIAEPAFTLSVNDNGFGFDPEAGNNHASLGLQSMQTRAAIINCKVDVRSEVGSGTTVTLYENI